MLTLVYRYFAHDSVDSTIGPNCCNTTTEAIVRRLSSEVFETLALDNGKAFAGHLRVAEKLKGGVYYCDPYAPW